jgi:hypothetical protein
MTALEAMKLLEMVTQYPNILWHYAMSKNIELEDFEDIKTVCKSIREKMEVLR